MTRILFLIGTIIVLIFLHNTAQAKLTEPIDSMKSSLPSVPVADPSEVIQAPSTAPAPKKLAQAPEERRSITCQRGLFACYNQCPMMGADAHPCVNTCQSEHSKCLEHPPLPKQN